MRRAVQALGRLAPGTMNKTEAAYSRELAKMQAAGLIAWWSFEPVSIKLAEGLRLTPDFLVMARDGALYSVDVKGSLAVYTDDAKAKMKMAAKLMPWPFFVVYPKKRAEGTGWHTLEVKA